MRISIDTKDDSPDEIRRAIRLLQHIIGEGALTNDPAQQQASQTNIFSEMFDNQDKLEQQGVEQGEPNQEGSAEGTKPQTPTPSSESTEDLFAELFSHEEIKEMKKVEDDGPPSQEARKHDIEFY